MAVFYRGGKFYHPSLKILNKSNCKRNLKGKFNYLYSYLSKQFIILTFRRLFLKYFIILDWFSFRIRWILKKLKIFIKMNKMIHVY
jgi:hypothetical protein